MYWYLVLLEKLNIIFVYVLVLELLNVSVTVACIIVVSIILYIAPKHSPFSNTPTPFPPLRSVWHISALHHTLPLCYHRHTSCTWQSQCRGFQCRYNVDSFGNTVNILYLQYSDYCRSGQAILVHWRLDVFQLTLNLYCSVIYQDVTNKVIEWNYGQLVL